jgi:drug/metabolite transporter (DMT)-like permease
LQRTTVSAPDSALTAAVQAAPVQSTALSSSRGLGLGIAAGLGAGAFWGLTFVAPLVVPGVRAMDVMVGRYWSCAAFALCVLLLQWWRSGREACMPSGLPASAPLVALAQSVLGYTGYYWLLFLAVEGAGAALPVLVIGTLPVWMMLLGKPAGVLWRHLLVGLLLTVLGLLMMYAATTASDQIGAVSGPDPFQGMLLAGAAMLSWLIFGFWNAAWLRQHPQLSSTTWANWQSVAAGFGACAAAWAWGWPDWSGLDEAGQLAPFVWTCLITGIGSGWVASVLWNMASRRLPASLAGQLIVSETLFGLTYAFAWTMEWPGWLQGVAALLFVSGILASIRAHR